MAPKIDDARVNAILSKFEARVKYNFRTAARAIRNTLMWTRSGLAHAQKHMQDRWIVHSSLRLGFDLNCTFLFID